MKRITLIIAFTALLLSCSKDEKQSFTIKNDTGINWIDATISVSNSSDAGAKIIDNFHVGDVNNGSSTTVNSDAIYFFVNAKDDNGKFLMSRKKALTKTSVITSSDLYER